MESSKSFKNVGIALAIGFILGAIVVHFMRDGSINYDEWITKEQFKRDSLLTRKSTESKYRDSLIIKLDSIHSKADSSLSKIKQSHDSIIIKSKNSRDEKIRLINSNDTTYINILSISTE